MEEYTTEALEVCVPNDLANLRLPDPTLLQYYKDVRDRIYWLDGEVCADTLDIVKAIMTHNHEDAGIPANERKPIKIMIDSGGGSVQVMWSIINAIKISETPVWTIVYCSAMSAAAHILAAGHRRFAFPGSVILVHSGSISFDGDVEKVESAKRYYDGVSKSANVLLVADTKIVPRDLKNKGSRDWYMTAEEALARGVVDSIVSDFKEVM